MEKVAFILVPSFSSSDWLNKKMHRITSASLKYLVDDYKEERYYEKIHEVSNYDQIQNFLNQAEFLIVSTAGSVFVDKDHLMKKIHEIPDDIGMITHLMQMPEDATTWMHEQFFIIRTAAVSTLDFTESTSAGPQLVRSKESVHGDHTPAEVTLGEYTERSMKFGSKVIEEVLSNGYRVVNFDKDWREKPMPMFGDGLTITRGYLYPKKSTTQFETALKTMTHVSGLDDAQNKFFDLVEGLRNPNFVNVYSYETPIERPQVETVVVPAIGMLGELIAQYTYASKIIFYDLNVNNIAFKKHLYANWDGQDYHNFAKTWCDENNLRIEPSFDGDIALSKLYEEKIKSHVYPNWKEIQSLDVEFLLIDIVKDIDEILKRVGSVPSIIPKTLLHTSTIFQDKYMPSAIFYEQEEIDAAATKIKNTPNIFWYQPQPGFKY